MNLTTNDTHAMEHEEYHNKVLIRPNTLYAWTISPDDKHQALGVRRPKSLGALSRLETVKKGFKALFTDMDISNIDYYLITEITEPFSGKSGNQIPRIHYHGYLWFPDASAILDYLQYTALDFSTKATTTIKPITDDNWAAYLDKQQFLFNGYPTIQSNNWEHNPINKKRKSSPSKDEPPERTLVPRLEAAAPKQVEDTPKLRRKTRVRKK